MKALLAGILAVLVAGCAESPTAYTGVSNKPYVAYATNQYDYVPANSPYRTWTTAQLQQRRRDLYGTVPYDRTRKGIPVYKYHGGPLPQQDEIFAIENELKRRYQAGDRTAELVRPIPGETHI